MVAMILRNKSHNDYIEQWKIHSSKYPDGWALVWILEPGTEIFNIAYEISMKWDVLNVYFINYIRDVIASFLFIRINIKAFLSHVFLNSFMTQLKNRVAWHI